MKKIRMVLILLSLLTLQFFCSQSLLYAEIIYTKDGKKIQAKIEERDGDTIWYETTSGEIVEYTGIDIAEIEKILNDDGSISEYSPIR